MADDRTDEELARSIARARANMKIHAKNGYDCPTCSTILREAEEEQAIRLGNRTCDECKAVDGHKQTCSKVYFS